MFECHKIKVYDISNATKKVPQLSFNIDGLQIDQVYEFNFLDLIIDANLNWKAHLNAIGTKVSRIIGLLHKLKYVFPNNILHSIYNHAALKLFAFGMGNKVQ